MLSRRSRREDLQARLSSLHEAALKLRERLGNPLADAAETGRYAAALMRDADRFRQTLANKSRWQQHTARGFAFSVGKCTVRTAASRHRALQDEPAAG